MLTTSVEVANCGWNAELQNAHAIRQHLFGRRSRPIAQADCSAVCRQATATDHSFSGRRIYLATMILKWLATLPGEPAR
jgi:hypothetical protein